MGRWAAFVLGILMVPGAWGAWWVFANVEAPGWAWFAAGVVSVLVVRAAIEIAQELRWALAETEETVFRPWFRPVWRALQRARLTAR